MSNYGPQPPSNDPYQPPQAPNNGQQWPQQNSYSNSPYQDSPYADQNPPKSNAKWGIIAAGIAVVLALIIAAVFAIPALTKKSDDPVVPAPTSSASASESADATDEPSASPSASESDFAKTDDYYLPTSLSSYPYEEEKYVSLKGTDEQYVAQIKKTVKTPTLTDEEILYTSKNICYALDNNVSIDKTIKHFVTLGRESSIPDYEMGVVFGGSVSFYCDSHLAEAKSYIEGAGGGKTTS